VLILAGRSAARTTIKHLTINGREYAVPFALLLRGLTTLELFALDAAIAAEGEILLPVQTYISALYGESLLDGQHRARIGAARGIEVPIICRGRMNEDKARRRALALNVPRRHLSIAEQAEQRGERIVKVAAAKADQKSNRAIAAELGVSEAQIRSDVSKAAASGAQGCAPGPVMGTDGKEYPPPKLRRKHIRKTNAQKVHEAGVELAKLIKKDMGQHHLLARIKIVAAMNGVPFDDDGNWPAWEGVKRTFRDLARPAARA
jgi:hypothetical protein